MSIVPGRRVGNTTRQVDQLVQDYFLTGRMVCSDHYHDGSVTTRARLSKMLFSLVQKRLFNEHHVTLNQRYLKVIEGILVYEAPLTHKS